MNDSHLGATDNIFGNNNNSSVPQLDSALRNLEAMFISPHANARDVNRVLQTQHNVLGSQSLVIGVVAHTMPYLGWHRVQLNDSRGVMRCCALSTASFMPFGVRDATVYPPGSTVLVYTPRNSPFGYIVGSIPSVYPVKKLEDLTQGKNYSDFISQGGMSGMFQEQVHSYPVQRLLNAASALDFSAGRPRDITSQEKVFSTATGLLFSLDDYMFQLRVNEMCGIWGSLIDSHLRIAGQQLLVESATYELDTGNDEGESTFVAGIATYPWEALGLSRPDTQIGSDYTDGLNNADAFKRQDDPDKGAWPYAPYDVSGKPETTGSRAAEDTADSRPFYRYREYGGYMGQGHVREVAVPLFDGKNTPSARSPEGVFEEWIGLDGSYHLFSAKSVMIGRRVNMPVAEQRKDAADGTGDDAKADNYRYSGYFGNATQHRVGDVRVPDDNPSIRRVMGVDELIAYAVNWKRVHPFHYHKNDYRVREESEGTTFTQVQDNLNFAELGGANTMSPVSPRSMRIDHRYAEVLYYQTTSFLCFLEDGGVVLADGFGSAIKMVGGKIRLECAGDIELVPGRNIVVMGNQIVLRAKTSVDISASDNDVRIKAQRNLHMLAGNGGQGGVLVECKGMGSLQEYENNIGQDVVSNGIVLKAPDSVVAAYGGDVYLRSAADKQINLDADKGRSQINFYGSRVAVFCNKSVDFLIGPSNEDSTVNFAYSFNATSAILPVNVLVGGNITNYGDNKSIFTTGGVYAKGSIATLKTFAQSKAGMVGKVPDTLSGALDDITKPQADAVAAFKDAGKEMHDAYFVQSYYQDKQLGNDTTIKNMQFSYRDTEDQNQYRTANMLWDQRRWEKFVSLGLGTGGESWIENPVSYQGVDLYPWPGRKAWKEEENFMIAIGGGLLDTATGNAASRASGVYDEPELGNIQNVTMEEGFLQIG